MEAAAISAIQVELAARRGKLEAALSQMGRPAALVRLLDEVDGALDRIQSGTFGLCDTCHEAIEPHRLAADPLLRVCLDHLDAGQRTALEQDLELAARIQQRLLPTNDLVRSGWDICYHYQPAGPVGGDYCDLLTPGDDVLFVLGDVSGHGVASSLLASHLHAMFRSLGNAPIPLEQVMSQANRVFCESTLSSHYATVVCGRAQPGGAMELASAGHCPPLRIGGGAALPLEATGLPLGLFCSAGFTTHQLQLGRGDTLLLYSDGLIEARNRAGREYGLERLTGAAVSTAQPSGSRQLVGWILDDWNRFRAGAPAEDDLTLMALQRVS